MALKGGHTFSHYRLLEVIGEGGMGVVWKAEDTTLHREVAIKVLPDSVASDPERLARFEREARAAAQLSNPNILQIHDFGSESGLTYAVSELLVGQNLRERLSGHALGWRKAVEIGIAISDGMAAAHAQRIIHRDLKPENVFLTEDGQVKILDFGIARIDPVVSADAPTQTLAEKSTSPGKVVGTAGYMSPEQLRGETIDVRSDLFSFGCVMYEMLAARRAFVGASGIETMAAILREEPPEISSTAAAFPSELIRIVQRCLAKSPAERFQSAGDLAFALRSLLSGNSLQQPIFERPNRSPLWWVAGGGVFVAFFLLAFWWIDLRDDSTEQTGHLNPDRVVVAVFENRTGDESLDTLGPMTSDWITQGLSQTGVVEVVPSMTTLLTVAGDQPRGAPLAAYAERTGAGVVVSGVYYLRQEALLFQATITDVMVDKIVHSFQPISGDRSDPMPAIEELRQRVMGFMVTRADPRGEVRLHGVPPLFEAYQEYMAGLEFFGLDDARSIQHFERAAELDRTLYAPRLFLLFMYGGGTNPDRAEVMLQDLLEDSEKLDSYERLWLDVIQARSEGHLFEALRLLQEAERISPSDLLVKDWIGVIGLALNRPQLVVDTMEGVDPEVIRNRSVVGPFWHVILTDAYHLLGEYQLEQEAARIAVRWYPDKLGLRWEEVEAASALGDLEEVERIIEQSLAIKPADSYHAGDVMLGAATELRTHGHHAESLALANRAVEWCHGRMTKEDRTDPLREFLARSFYKAERWTDSRQLYRQLAADDPENITYLGYLGMLAARLEESSEARSISDELRSNDQTDQQVEITFWRARIAALLGEHEQAMALVLEGFAQGASFGVHIHSDMDLEALRDYPPFQELQRPKG